MTMEQGGAVPLPAASVREALRVLHDERPNLLLADIGMPEQDGFDLIHIVRALPADAGGRTPAIAVTAYTSVRERGEVLRAGYDAHVVKPVEPERLMAAIAAITNRS